jgi:hypothetical protein
MSVNSMLAGSSEVVAPCMNNRVARVSKVGSIHSRSALNAGECQRRRERSTQPLGSAIRLQDARRARMVASVPANLCVAAGSPPIIESCVAPFFKLADLAYTGLYLHVSGKSALWESSKSLVRSLGDWRSQVKFVHHRCGKCAIHGPGISLTDRDTCYRIWWDSKS